MNPANGQGRPMIESSLFEAHFARIPFPIYAVDVTNHEIIFTNRQFRETFGDHKGKPCYKELYDADRPCAFCRIPDLVTRDGQPNGRTLVFEHFTAAPTAGSRFRNGPWPGPTAGWSSIPSPWTSPS
jgi:hypothetical protein